MSKKLNVLLSLTDSLRGNYKRMVADYKKFFEKSQGNFLGTHNTYTQREGTIDEPSKRKTIPVATTVDEKIDWFMETSAPFVDALFSQEKTNAMGLAKASLIVDGLNWGEYTSLELLRLRSLIESADLGGFVDMVSAIPVRSDREVWKLSGNPDYSGREVFETEMVSGVNKTTIKEPKILVDPNLKGKELPVNYQPATVAIDTVFELGDYTTQHFSGQWSHRQRAMVLKRRTDLHAAIIEALKNANEVESVDSNLNSETIFGYLFFGATKSQN